MTLPLVLALLSGCDPHDGTVTGRYVMYFAAATSGNVQHAREAYEPVACTYEQDDPLATEFDYEQIYKDDCWKEKVEAEKKFQDELGLRPLDCRGFRDAPYSEDGTPNAVRIRDSMIPGWEDEYESYCCAEAVDDDPDNDPDGDMFTTGDCTPRQARFANWLDDKAFYAKTDEIVTWREEALLTAEGDLQLTVHMNTEFGDVRFGWVIKPGFAPTECVDVDGVSTERPLFEDSNWIDGWSNMYEEDDGYTVYLLNDGAYQLNPNNPDDAWYFDYTWSAGAAFSRFGDELAYQYTSDYADYSDAASVPFFVSRDDEGKITGGYPYDGGQYPELNCGDGGDGCLQVLDYADFIDLMKDNFHNGGVDRDGVEYSAADHEFADYGRVTRDEFEFNTKIEDNSWRTTAPGAGADAEGFDGWSSVNPSWVRLKIDREKLDGLEPGVLTEPITGDFQLMFYSADTTGSVWAFEGSFSIDRIGEDVWGAEEELDDLKRAENETASCGE